MFRVNKKSEELFCTPICVLFHKSSHVVFLLHVYIKNFNEMSSYETEL